MVSIARLSVLKQSFFSLPGQYGRCVTRVNDFPSCRNWDALPLSYENRRHKAIKLGVGDKSSIAAAAAVELVHSQAHINVNPGTLISLFSQLLNGVSFMKNPC